MTLSFCPVPSLVQRHLTRGKVSQPGPLSAGQWRVCPSLTQGPTQAFPLPSKAVPFPGLVCLLQDRKAHDQPLGQMHVATSEQGNSLAEAGQPAVHTPPRRSAAVPKPQTCPQPPGRAHSAAIASWSSSPGWRTSCSRPRSLQSSRGRENEAWSRGRAPRAAT